jgi:hypothetical protein
MQRTFKNIFVNTFKGIKEVSEAYDATYYKCLKCGNELIARKGYGKLRLLCKCGHAATVYTGKDIHFMSDIKKTERQEPRHVIARAEREKMDEQLRVDIFYKHLKSDLAMLCNLVNKNRDITKQARYKDCVALLEDYEKKQGYEKITKYLQQFCDLQKVPLNIVWEPLSKQNTLSSTEKEANILGTTYFLPLKPLLFYTIYLNQKFTSCSDIMIATIAHELSHIYANHNNIQFTSPDNQRGNKAYNEQMTDLLGIALGMGELMSFSSERAEAFDTGYLTNDMICSAYNLWKTDYLERPK